jgi:hypothetical protein
MLPSNWTPHSFCRCAARAIGTTGKLFADIAKYGFFVALGGTKKAISNDDIREGFDRRAGKASRAD